MLDTRDGSMHVVPAPRGPGPYGITTTPAGNVFYASLAGNHIARVFLTVGTNGPPPTAPFGAEPIDPPTARQGARRIWSDSTGALWVSEWNTGQVARYDLATQSWKEWKLPGASPMTYAVYVDDADIVWLSDFGANAIVRFDPRTETFSSLPFARPGADVRQLLGRPGEVWGAMSGQDKLVLVRTR
jgi:virginiamycin B lyase